MKLCNMYYCVNNGDSTSPSNSHPPHHALFVQYQLFGASRLLESSEIYNSKSLSLVVPLNCKGDLIEDGEEADGGRHPRAGGEQLQHHADVPVVVVDVLQLPHHLPLSQRGSVYH